MKILYSVNSLKMESLKPFLYITPTAFIGFCTFVLLTPKFTCFVALLSEVSQRVTNKTELYSLGAQLGVKDYAVDSILHDYPRINDAGYQVLFLWKQEGILQRKSGKEMKETLRSALCSDFVKMNRVAKVDLKHHFQ